MNEDFVIGPFSQVLPFAGLPLRGPIKDDEMKVVENGGLLVSGGTIKEVGEYEMLCKSINKKPESNLLDRKLVALPGFIDPHTHIAFGGSRAKDFALRLMGMSYLDIARQGGGIWSTVTSTRSIDQAAMAALICDRADIALQGGVTTIEVKSGYGLSVDGELRLLRSIQKASALTHSDLIPTCLAAHSLPKDYDGTKKEYLDHMFSDLIPIIQRDGLTNRMDIFVEKEAFSVEEARGYLTKLKNAGFQLTIHGDQFSTGGSALAVELNAMSVDHLEASGTTEIEILAKSNTVATILPGASIGLGCNFGPARRLLDHGAIVAFGSDWNPGSAPMGDFLTEVCVLASFEKLTIAEAMAGMTFRAAYALGLEDRGRLMPGNIADVIAFPCKDYREIIYFQGSLRPAHIWKAGKLVV